MEDVDLNVLGEDAEGDVDRPGWPGGVQQSAEHGLADLPDPLFGERRLRKAAPDEVPDIGNRRRTGRKNLRQHHDGNYLNGVLFRPETRLGHHQLLLTNTRRYEPGTLLLAGSCKASCPTPNSEGRMPTSTTIVLFIRKIRCSSLESTDITVRTIER
jgi:hypothetical protein